MPTQINSQILNYYFVIICEALEIEATMPQLCTFHMDLHPPTHVQLKESNDGCLGYAMFDYLQVFNQLGVIYT